MTNTKDKIINVADKIFSKFGFRKTSMDEIARIARKAKGSLYYYFENKEELFKEVITKEINNLKRELTIIVDDPEMCAKKKLKKYLLKRMKILNNSANYQETLKADFFEHFDFIDDLRKDFDVWEKKNLKKIFKQGIENGEFDKPDDLNIIINVLIMVLKGLEVPFFLHNNYDELLPRLDNLLNILIKGLSKS